MDHKSCVMFDTSGYITFLIKEYQKITNYFGWWNG